MNAPPSNPTQNDAVSQLWSTSDDNKLGPTMKEKMKEAAQLIESRLGNSDFPVLVEELDRTLFELHFASGDLDPTEKEVMVRYYVDHTGTAIISILRFV